MSRSSQTASLPSTSLGDPQAVSSCLVTIQSSARAGGASQREYLRGLVSHADLLRIPTITSNGLCIGYGTAWRAVPSPVLHFLDWGFLFWLRRSKILPVSSILGYGSLRSFGSSFLRSSPLPSGGISFALSRWRPQFGPLVLHPGIWTWFCIFWTRPPLSLWLCPLFVTLRRRSCFSSPWLLPQGLVSFKRSLSMCLLLPLHLFVICSWIRGEDWVFFYSPSSLFLS